MDMRIEAGQTIENGLLGIFKSLDDGNDISPAERYRLEGYIDAVIQLQILNVDEIKLLFQNKYKQVYHADIPESYLVIGDGSYPQFVIPVVMQRSPVYPST